jgi:predicted metalloprotease
MMLGKRSHGVQQQAAQIRKIPSINTLTQQMRSHDKDHRFMAVSDLINGLKNSQSLGQVNDSIEKSLFEHLIKLLADSNGEVQQLSSKAISLLISTSSFCSDQTINMVCENLFNNLNQPQKNSDEDSPVQLDIYALAFHEIVKSLIDLRSKNVRRNNVHTALFQINTQQTPPSNIFTKISERMLTILRKRFKTLPFAVQLELVNMLTLILTQNYQEIEDFFPKIQQTIRETALVSNRPTLIKSGIACICAMITNCNDSIFNNIIEGQHNNLTANSFIIASFNLLTKITGKCPNRIADNLDKFVGFIQFHIEKLLNTGYDEVIENPSIIVNAESAIGFLESMFKFAGSKSINTGINFENVLLKMLKYDPNVFENDSDDEDISEENENSDSDEEFSDGEEEEDEDLSYQIRITACRTINALIPLHLKYIPIEATHAESVLLRNLIKRLKERDDSVKQVVLETFLNFLKWHKEFRSPDTDLMAETKIKGLTNLAKIINSGKNIKSRQSACIVAETLLKIDNNVPIEVGDNLINSCVNCLDRLNLNGVDSNSISGVKISALQALAALPNLTSKNQNSVQFIQSSIQDSFYSVSLQAIQTTESVVKTMEIIPVHFQPIVLSLQDRTSNSDVDHEVKTSAIKTFSICLTKLENADDLQAGLEKLLFLFDNELVRLNAIKSTKKVIEHCFDKIPDIPGFSDKIDLSMIAGLLRKADQGLRREVCKLLNVLLSTKNTFNGANSEIFSQQILPSLIDSLKSQPLVYICSETINLMLNRNFLDSNIVKKTVYAAIFQLFTVLTERENSKTREKVMQLYQSVSKINQKVCYNDISASPLIESNRCLIANVATAVSIDLMKNCIGDVDKFLQGFFNLILTKQDKLSISCIGEIGRLKDLSGYSQQIEQSLIKIVVNTDGSFDAEVMAYAARSFGLVIAGSNQYLNPTFELINKIQDTNKNDGQNGSQASQTSLQLLLKSLSVYINASKTGDKKTIRFSDFNKQQPNRPIRRRENSNRSLPSCPNRQLRKLQLFTSTNRKRKRTGTPGHATIHFRIQRSTRRKQQHLQAHKSFRFDP